jgi:hypothetical protein
LEHCFLQPVATGEVGLNFEATVFLFVKDDSAFLDVNFEKLEKYAVQLVKSFAPAHMMMNLKWRVHSDPAKLDALLLDAYPKEDVFYFNEDFSTKQLDAMKTLMNDWVLGRDHSPKPIH